MNSYDALHQVSLLSFNVSLLIIVSLPTDRASLILTFVLHKPLEAIEAFLMENVRATEDSLFLEPQLFIANGAWFLLIETLQGFLFNLFPLVLG